MTIYNLTDFAAEVESRRANGESREGAYRSAITRLIEGVGESLGLRVEAINEAARTDCGAPDFLVKRDSNVVGYIEQKDIHVKLRNMNDANREQQVRYRKGLPNLIYTNCLDWDLYRDGGIEPVWSASLGHDHEKLDGLLKMFLEHEPVPITDPEKLAERMAGKTTMLKIALCEKFSKGGKSKTLDDLESHYNAFSQTIMQGKSKTEFAELYAETIAYGFFAARMNISEGKKFTRLEARSVIPKNNPFLGRLFRYITSEDIDSDVDWIIDDLVDLLSVCDVPKLMERFMKVSGKEDPFLHFFETFLGAYDPKRRKETGIYYTPQQVVKFIVRAVDQVLKDELKIENGLSNISEIPNPKDKDGGNLHKVRVLDPAVGTGTFLVEVIQRIAPTVKKRMGSAKAWTKFVERHLIPRLHGFEILMAPYAMCFAKIDMILRSFGYTPSDAPSRLEIYLNDALDMGDEQPMLPGLEWLSKEASLARLVKHGEKPIMCVIGNPPYKQAKAPLAGTAMHTLLKDYMSEPGTNVPLKEHTTGHLNDLYLQFMRISSHLINENEEGVIGLITNNSYIDGPTHRGVRYHLQKTFDKIWIVNLHGDTQRREKAPDGSADSNVFKIVKGVSIIIGVKTGKGKNGMATVKSMDLYGTREFKLKTLQEMTISDPRFETVDSYEPYFLLFNTSRKNRGIYDNGFRLEEMMPFPKKRSGFTTGMDKFALTMTLGELQNRLVEFARMEDADAKRFLKSFLKNSNKADRPKLWNQIREEVRNLDYNLFEEYTYRPFDSRWVYYTGVSEGLILWNGKEAMSHMEIPDNISIAVTNGFNLAGDYKHVFCHQGLCDYSLVSTGPGEICQVFPLMLREGGMALEDGRNYNFDQDLYSRFADLVGKENISPMSLFNYIYGVLHCPSYRSVYRDFLRIDFPRIPWPASLEEFQSISAKGNELINLHLMKSQFADSVSYDLLGEDGDDIIGGKSILKLSAEGKVNINPLQFFENVPEEVWNFRIGSYYPAQDWLKRRKGMELDYTDIIHYEKILNTLSETHRIMETIEMDLPDE